MPKEDKLALVALGAGIAALSVLFLLQVMLR
jgi:hypothetical protein